MSAGAGPLRVLVVDDEPAIRRFLRAGLSSQGYVVSELEEGLPAVDVARRKGTDLIVLDLGLPDIDGTEVIGRVRAGGSSVPIIVLSSRSDEAAKVDALDLGADDFVTKPFGIDELLARIRAAQRHRLQREGETPIFRSGDLTVDLVRRIVTVRGNEVKFSPREYAVLRLLVQHAGKVLTHKMILREVWGGADTDVQYLRIYVRALRQKIEANPERPAHIQTETGVGYRLRVNDQDSLNWMDIIDFLTPDRVVLEVRARDKTALIGEIARQSARTVRALRAETVESALVAREQLGSTGLGSGFALPHARIDGLGTYVGLFIRLAKPIDFAAIDGKPVLLVFVLLIPSESTTPHVAALAAISRRFRDADLVTQLRNAKTPAEAYGFLTTN